MEKKYFTIQIFSSDGLTAITKRVSKKFLVSVLSLFIIVVLCILTLIAFYGRVYVKAMKVRNLEERNKYLETEFKKIEILSKDIAEIAKQREKLDVALGIKNTKGKEEIKRPEEIKKDDIKVDKHDEVTFTNPEMEKYLEKSKKKSRSIPNLIPVNGWITKGFGTVHRGVDIAAPVGTPILSSIDGNVSFTGWDSILGSVIKVEGASEFTTIYGHCSSIYVKKGDFVRKGEIIASVGKTGRAEAPHLHYEIEVSGVSVNPELFFKIY